MLATKKNVFIILGVLSLSACNQPQPTLSYLLQNPDVVKTKVDRCENQEAKTSQQMQECELVYQAANQLMELMSEQQHDPEGFGQKILDKEIALVNAKLALTEAKVNLERVSKQNDATELQKQKQEYDRAQLNYKQIHEQLRSMLAVVGLNSPE